MMTSQKTRNVVVAALVKVMQFKPVNRVLQAAGTAAMKIAKKWSGE